MFTKYVVFDIPVSSIPGTWQSLVAELPNTTGIDLPRLLEAEMKLEYFCKISPKWKLRILNDVLGEESPLINDIMTRTMVSAVKAKG